MCKQALVEKAIKMVLAAEHLPFWLIRKGLFYIDEMEVLPDLQKWKLE